MPSTTPRAALGWLLLGALLIAGPAGAATVGVLKSGDAAVYTRADAGLSTALAGHARIVTHTVGTGPFPGDTDIVIAIGTDALASALRGHPDTPLLAVLVPRATVDTLRARGPERTAPFAALYLDQPLERQIRVAHALFPGLERVGAVLAPESTLSGFASAGATIGDVEIERWRPDEPPLRAVTRLSGRVDAIIALPDSRIYNPRSIHGILLASYRANVPLIGYSRTVVEAGALASAWYPPRGHGLEAGAMLAPFLDAGGRADWPASRYSNRFRIAVNERVARSLGLQPTVDPADRIFRAEEPIE